MKKHVIRWLPSVILALVALPSLTLPLVTDDWIQRARIERVFTYAGPWDLYSFAPGDPARLMPFVVNGPLPWFTLPELKLSFFRPLSVFLLHLDVWLWGTSATLARVHSIAWALLMLEAARRLYARLLPRAATFATLLFAIDDSHLGPTVWIANRNSLVAVALALWGLLAHLEWRDGRRPWWMATALFALALAASEAALGVLAFLLALELLRPRAERALGALWPLCGLLVSYVVVYHLAGAGTWGSAMYVDPIREPLTYLREAPMRFLTVLGGWSSGIGADVWLTTPALSPVLLACGVLAIPGWWWLARTTRLDDEERATLRRLGLGAAFGLLPTLATVPSNRLLSPISLGLCGVVGTFVASAYEQRRRLVLAWAAFAFGLVHLTSWVFSPRFFAGWAEGIERSVLHPLGVDTLEHKRVVLVSSTDSFVATYGASAMAHAGRSLPLTWHVLSMAPAAHRVTRLSERAFELEVVGGRMLDSVFEQLWRAPERFPVVEGARVDLNAMHVTPERCEGGRPVKLRVELDLDPAAYTFVVWNGHELEQIQLPTLGATVELPRVSLLAEQVLGANQPSRAGAQEPAGP